MAPRTSALLAHYALAVGVASAYQLQPALSAWRSSRARPSPIAMAAEPSSENIEERIQFLRRRESELKKIIEEEEAATAAPAPQSDIAAQSDITIRLPEGVQPGQRLSATLANGVRVRFIAPENAQPGQILRVKGPANAAIGPAEDQGDYDDEDEDYDDDDDEEYDDEEEYDDDDEYDEYDEDGEYEDGDGESVMAVEEDGVPAETTGELERVVAVPKAPPNPATVAAAKAIRKGEVGKALLTSIFGESKNDRMTREAADAERAAQEAEEAAELARVAAAEAEAERVSAAEAGGMAATVAAAAKADKQAADL